MLSLQCARCPVGNSKVQYGKNWDALTSIETLPAKVIEVCNPFQFTLKSYPAISFLKSLLIDFDFIHCMSGPTISVDSLLLFRINLLFALHMFYSLFTGQ